MSDVAPIAGHQLSCGAHISKQLMYRAVCTYLINSGQVHVVKYCTVLYRNHVQ